MASKKIIHLFLFFLLFSLSCIIKIKAQDVGTTVDDATLSLAGPTATSDTDLSSTGSYSSVTSVSSATDLNPSITDSPASAIALQDTLPTYTTLNQTTTTPSQGTLIQPTVTASQPALQALPTSQPSTSQPSTPQPNAPQPNAPQPNASQPSTPQPGPQKNSQPPSSAKDNNNEDDGQTDALDSTSGASTVIMTRKSDYYSGIMAALSMIVIGSVLMI
ncbi:892_t:CDS:2 [Cetraspora pellucida]|uniref:892_t:CDS:1 n=1 Tax=Cetraspora pellucida TaxID=1433469 RepID=A0A9N9EHS1_9GLOM|nr:892_t:CDS:2 [Cetraspora pellucida]